MCGIVGTPNFKKGLDMATLVKARGTRAWSLSIVNMVDFSMRRTHCNEDVFTKESAEKLFQPAGQSLDYYIFHLQSPTSKAYRHHPAVKGNHFLWHNGMIDSSEHSKMAERTWDTQLILESIIDENNEPDWSKLNDFKGSFACYYLWEGHGLYFFRNMISPQFADRSSYSYSSVTFPHAEKLPANKVFNMKTGEVVATFNNTYNPFGV